MTSSRRRSLFAAGVAAALAAAVSLAPAAAAAGGPGGDGRGWSGAWSTAPQPPMGGEAEPNWSQAGFAGQSIRQVVRVSAGGSQVRIRLSNAYGTRPLRLAGATIAKAGEGAAVRQETVRRLTFGRSPSATIAPGGAATSDTAPLSTAPLDKLTVTAYFAEPTGAATFHEGGLTTTYRAAGDQLFDGAGGAFGETSHSWYFLTGVDVSGGPRPFGGAVVAFGDSITDGAVSTPGADNRYPDELAERLVAAGRPMGVLNAGINGNMLLTDSPCFSGVRGVARFSRDVLEQPGVRTAIVLMGVNDIGLGGLDLGCGTPPLMTPDRLIEGHRALIRAAHARGITIIGATITPFKGNEYYDSPRNEAVRDAVNRWIRRSGEYDQVVDLDRVLADPADRDALNPAYDGGDRLHPNDAGMKAMAAAVDLDRL
ncbi:SGNH/GDSL hydrolase family protein [Sphaerisporangium perillae]|uniref:SGNH/GDSL hydrolase family protein n=1 Tax=Sphaerisporangium perillae TaxID=2935860 RepID=UPI00200C0117|nr:SGNH/GDSL hydrolase family protein [Sphaerisporangium perillae]